MGKMTSINSVISREDDDTQKLLKENKVIVPESIKKILNDLQQTFQDVSRQNRPRYERNSSATGDNKKTSHKQKLIKNQPDGIGDRNKNQVIEK